jgi:hypothetical protein
MSIYLMNFFSTRKTGLHNARSVTGVLHDPFYEHNVILDSQSHVLRLTQRCHHVADCYVSHKTNALQKISNLTADRGSTFLQCAELESQLEETCKELRSSQLIIKLLYKEINESATEKPSRPTTTIPEYEPSVDATSTNRWSTIVSKRQYNRNKTRTSDNHCNQSTEIVNSYTMLHNLPETPNYQDRNEMPRFMEVTPTSTNNNNTMKNYRRIRNPTLTHHPRNTTQYLPPSHHELQDESRSDQNPNWIPTIVNGQVKQTKKETNLDSTINKRNYIHNLLSESTTKLLNSRAK